MFGKLQDHEIEPKILEKHEIQVKDSKYITRKIKVKNHESNQDDESTSDEDDDLIKKFEKFIRKEKKKEIIQKEAPRRNVTCFEYGERKHVKSECPSFQKKNKLDIKKEKRLKKAYVEWDDNEISSSSNEDHASNVLTTSHHSSDEEYEVSDSEIDDKPSYDELQSAFYELYDEFWNFLNKRFFFKIYKVRLISQKWS